MVEVLSEMNTFEEEGQEREGRQGMKEKSRKVGGRMTMDSRRHEPEQTQELGWIHETEDRKGRSARSEDDVGLRT